MLKRERAHQFLKGAVGTAFMALAAACAHTNDPVYAPTSAPPQQAIGSSATYAESSGDTDPTALQDFHPALDAYGTWSDDPTYGTVWTPSVAETGPDFVPYVSGGHWVYGDDYAWNSDYSWGWAPFHYGRWVHLEARGWSWIPGREYAPAWVEWRAGNAYVGWSPAPPLFVWRGGVAVRLGFAPPAPPFVFCAHDELFAPQPGRVVITGPRALAIGRSTHFYGAPDARGHFHRGPPLASLHIAPEHVVRATGHERGLARAQAFSRPSRSEAARREGERPKLAHAEGTRPKMMRSEGPPPRAGHVEGARSKVTRTEGPRPKVTRTESPRPKLAHAASPNPKGTHVEAPRPEGRAERQAPEPHQAQRQESAHPAPARSEGAHTAAPQVTRKPASPHTEAPTHEGSK